MSCQQWIIDTARTYWAHKASGATDDVAAMRTIDAHREAIGHLAPSSVAREMRGHRRKLRALGLAGDGWAEVPAPAPEAVAELLTVTQYRDAQLWFDVHAPQHNQQLIEVALARAVRNGVRRLVLGGDTLNLGWASSFLDDGKPGPEHTEGEMLRVEGLFDVLFDTFDEVILIAGNHDQGRWRRLVGGSVGFRRLLKMVMGDAVDRLVMTGRRYCLLDSPLGVWRVTHQAGKGRKKPLSAASELALKKGQNVIMGHEHYLGLVQTECGRHWAANGGHMADESIMSYRHIMDTTHTAWAPGFVEMVDGFVQLVPERVARLWAVEWRGAPAA